MSRDLTILSLPQYLALEYDLLALEFDQPVSLVTQLGLGSVNVIRAGFFHPVEPLVNALDVSFLAYHALFDIG
tara:strand:- start:1977 stop:2195 length:219 start_codon:yes stop_codon:yes gene_type:complete